MTVPSHHNHNNHHTNNGMANHLLCIAKRPRQWILSTSLLALALLLFSSSRQQQSTQWIRSSTAVKHDETTAPVATGRPIRQISILGERNSGTRWTFGHISECFNHTLTVKKELTRYKHWFQYDAPEKYPHDTLVVAQFRNPYDWLKAMQHVPHHSPAHLRTSLTATTDQKDAGNDWKTFLTKPWTTERVGKDLDILRNGKNVSCQDDFDYKDIVSCVKEPLPKSYYNWTIRYSEHQPFYEMRNDGSGLPYDNILELRTDKIRNFLSVVDYEGVADVWVVQYEYLLAKGTQHLIDRIQEWTGVEPRCESKPSQIRPAKRTRRITKEFAAHVRQHLNWTVEGWIGYDVEWDREQESSKD